MTVRQPVTQGRAEAAPVLEPVVSDGSGARPRAVVAAQRVPDRLPERMPDRSVPQATAARLPGYLHALRGLGDGGAETVSSQALAAAAGVSPAKLRKDLSYLGSFGTRGVGYDVEYLKRAISTVLGVADRWAVAIVGVGNLGRALAHYEGFPSRGLRVEALFDVAPDLVGTTFGGLTVHHVAQAPQVLGGSGIRIGVIAVPVSAAQHAADALVAGGVRSLLSFAATAIAVPEDVNVRSVDLSAELQLLGFREYHRREVKA